MDLIEELKNIIAQCEDLKEVYSQLSDFFIKLRNQGMKDYQIDDLIRKTKELISDEIDKKILNGLEKEKSPTEIGKEVGLQTSTIKHRIENMSIKGIKIPEKSKKTTKKVIRRKTKNDKIDNEILKRLADGETMREIAEELGVTKQAISYRIRTMRERKTIIPNAKEIRNVEIDNQIKKELAKGKTCNQIAERLGLSYHTISKKTSKLKEREREINKQLAKEIIKLIDKRHATIRQIRTIAEYYGVDIEEVLNSIEMDER